MAAARDEENPLGILSKLKKQSRKPRGWVGRSMVRGMNFSHSRMTDWGLGHITIKERWTALDVGCGGGRTVGKLARIATDGKAYGIDISEDSVRVSRRENEQLIRAGRVDVRHGSVSSLPFTDRTFELVTAVNSHYYWPDLVAGMQEVLRVLKPGGTLVIVGEAYKGGRDDERKRKSVASLGITLLTASELGERFSMAGYTDVQILEEHDKGWVCGIGRRAGQSSNE